MEHRNFELRTVDPDKREVVGLAIPYRQEINVGNYKERIERGAADTATKPVFFFNHTDPIGVVEEMRDLEEGLEIRARISNTQRGNDALELIKDGAITGLSIGFEPVEHRNVGKTVIRTKINIKEISAVPFPAYSEAQIAEVREDKGDIINMQELEELRNSMEELDRRVAMFQVNEPTPQYRGSVGEMIKRGLTDTDFLRSVASTVGKVTDDPTAGENVYADYYYNLINLGRPLTTAFGVSRLPDSGATVSFLQVAATADVGVQAAEGDELTARKLAFTAGSATVKTYGGANRISRQVLERSDIPYIEALMRSLGIEYAKEIEAVTAAAVDGATWVNGLDVPTGATGRAAAYLKAVASAAASIYTGTGYNANFIAAPTVEFIDIVSLADTTGRPVFAVNNDGSNTLGSANIAQVSASIAGIPVVHVPQLTTGSIYTFSSEAIDVWESAGAPVQLVQDQIITLQQDVAVYGYSALGVRHALAGVESVVTP